MTYKKTAQSRQLLHKRKEKPAEKKQRIVVLFNKPFQVLCQFTDESPKHRQTLSDFIPIKDIYAAGRLDYDSEGLLLLTNDGKLQSRISHPKFKQAKTYYVQVDGHITDAALKKLGEGVDLKDGRTRAATAERSDEPFWLWPRTPPIRYRKDIPTSWIKLVLTEGKNRQVRRMTAAVGFPTLRLIRYGIGEWTLADIKSGDYKQIN